MLRDRLASGAAGNVLFTDNPVKNAPMLLNDMRVLFPDQPDIFLVGPTLQLNWGYLLFLDLGVFIELPGPRKIFIAGSAHMLVGALTGVAVAKTVGAGIVDAKARELNKFLKDLGLKGVSSQTQGDQIRVSGKKRDDLQAVIVTLDPGETVIADAPSPDPPRQGRK